MPEKRYYFFTPIIPEKIDKPENFQMIKKYCRFRKRLTEQIVLS